MRVFLSIISCKWLLWTLSNMIEVVVSELRSCVKVEVDVLGSRP